MATRLFRMEFDKGRKSRKLIKQNVKDLKDLKWFWRKVTPDIARAHARYWNTEGGDRRTGFGSGWLPLSTMAVLLRRFRRGYYVRPSREGPEHKILHWTGSLRNSFASAAGTEHSIRRFYRNRMDYGSRHPRAEEHHFGSNDVPARYLLAEDASLDAVAKSAKRIISRRLGA